MGYTHYWTQQRPPTPAEWARFVADCGSLFATTTVPLAAEYDDPDEPPVASPAIVRFNGVGEDGHETFLIDPDDRGFTFCKTNYKPYDAVVCAALIALERAAPGAYEISSDGSPVDWKSGLDFARQVLGADCAIPLGEK
jgi:hypothetical protein